MRIAVAGGTGVVGKFVVEAAEAAGHDVVSLSRRTGVDVRTGEGLQARCVGSTSSSTRPMPGRPTGTRPRRSSPRSPVTSRRWRGGGGVAARGPLHRGPRAGARLRLLRGQVGAREGGAGRSAPDDHRAGHPVPRVPGADPGLDPPRPVRRGSPEPDPAGGGARGRPGLARSGRGTGPREARRGQAGTGRGRRSRTGGSGVVGPRRRPPPGRPRLRVIPFRVPGQAGSAMRSGGQLPTPDVRIVGPSFSEWIEGSDLALGGVTAVSGEPGLPGVKRDLKEITRSRSKSHSRARPCAPSDSAKRPVRYATCTVRVWDVGRIVPADTGRCRALSRRCRSPMITTQRRRR